MKKSIFLTALCLTVLLVNANNYRNDDGRYKYEMKKTVEKTFNVGDNPVLDMDGKYSDFIITTWDQPQIDFKVNVSVKCDDEDKLRAKFNSIEIQLGQDGEKVTAATVFGDYKYKSFNGSMTIRYYVQVPADVAMDLQTKYGDITLDQVREKLKVELKYGDLKADNILIDDIKNNVIEVKYGNINIDNVNQMALWLEYGDAKINTCDYIDGTLKYSKIFVTDMNHCMLELKYSDARIEKANKVLFVSTAYSDMKVSNCTNLLSAKMRYSDMSATMTSDSPIVDIDGAYSDAVLYINASSSFKYDLSASYGDITFKGFFDTKSINGRGQYGDGECGRLDISTKYGDVKIYKNK
ncbi:MAG: DUF4097 family beta strand repeat protein [Bacteroidales bacterium]|nr:DUF4097 family beta strand repeat protein [Bacteroidales bacterium]